MGGRSLRWSVRSVPVTGPVVFFSLGLAPVLVFNGRNTARQIRNPPAAYLHRMGSWFRRAPSSRPPCRLTSPLFRPTRLLLLPPLPGRLRSGRGGRDLSTLQVGSAKYETFWGVGVSLAVWTLTGVFFFVVDCDSSGSAPPSECWRYGCRDHELRMLRLRRPGLQRVLFSLRRSC